MKRRFDPRQGLVIVRSRIWGPTGRAWIQMALDTGATTTLINEAQLTAVGYGLTDASQKILITTGSGIERVVRFPMLRLEALGRTRREFPVLAHTLPPTASVDGVLGLDFLRGQTLTLDFRLGEIELD